MQRAVRVRLLLKIERFLLSRILAIVGRRWVLRRRCRSAGSSIIAAGIQDKKGENAEIFKKLHIDDCRVELKLKKRCSLFLKAYGFYKNMRNAIHPGVSHSRAGKIKYVISIPVRRRFPPCSTHRSASLLDGVKPACFNNIPIASGAPLSVSAGILSGMPPCARWLKSCSARAAAADE